MVGCSTRGYLPLSPSLSLSLPLSPSLSLSLPLSPSLSLSLPPSLSLSSLSPLSVPLSLSHSLTLSLSHSLPLSLSPSLPGRGAEDGYGHVCLVNSVNERNFKMAFPKENCFFEVCGHTYKTEVQASHWMNTHTGFVGLCAEIVW